MKEILYILLEQYADHELAFLTQGITSGEMGMRSDPRYCNKIVAPTSESVTSIGGLRTVPDYTFDNIPSNYAALVLVGGYGWATPIADRLLPIVQGAVDKGILVAAICNAASWMAKQGLLNKVRHTGNGIEQLTAWGGENYKGAALYEQQQAVADGNIITANGTGYLEFTREVLLALHNDSDEMTERYYTFQKMGLTALLSAMQQ